MFCSFAALVALVVAPPPGPNRPDEPRRLHWSPAKAAAFLDHASLTWTREKKCGTCHTNYPFLLARPALGDSPAAREVRQFFEGRAAHWDTAKPRWPTEVVATAAAL